MDRFPRGVHRLRVLTKQTRQRIRDAWGNEPFDQYGATETADIAAEHHACRHIHFFRALVIAEVVDEQYRPVPSGEYGSKVLITTLFSRTQPLIRYELNDSLRLSAEADWCGLPFARAGKHPGTGGGHFTPAGGVRR